MKTSETKKLKEKRYYQDNKEKIKQRSKDYYKKNKKRILKNLRENYPKNRERKLEQMRKWYQKNKKSKIENTKNYQKETNYASEKTDVQRQIRYIKRETRRKYPLINQKCEVCKIKKAIHHHHTTNPIKIDEF